MDPAEDASSFAMAILFNLQLITCPQMTLLFLLQLGDLMSRKLLQGSESCSVSIPWLLFLQRCIWVCYTIQQHPHSLLPFKRDKPQNGRGRQIAQCFFFSVKPLLKFPGQLISFPPCSAIATSIFPKTSSLLYLPAAKLLSAVCL